MSFGGDTNAYTDFQSTVYTCHAPTHLREEGKGGEKKDNESCTVRNVLFALHQLAFKALFIKEHIDNERGPILSEVGDCSFRTKLPVSHCFSDLP